MSATLLLHVSDIHAKVNDKLSSVASSIAGNVLPTIEAIERIVVCMTGDLTYSGDPKQTDCLVDFCAELGHSLKARFGCTPYFVAVPGNHDCDLSQADANRQYLINAARKVDTLLTNDLGWGCANVQKAFFAWLPSIDAPTPDASPFGWVYRIDGKPSIRFVCINTAWMSVMREPHGECRLPLPDIESLLQSDEDDLVVVLAHHPPSWMNPEVGRKLTEMLSAYADITLWGHEHIAGTHAIADLNLGTQTEFHYGSVLLHGEIGTTHGFKGIVLAEDGKRIRVEHYMEDGRGYVRSTNFDWRDLASRTKPKCKLPQLEPQHERWLNESSLNLSHPLRPAGPPTLTDLYVWPLLRIDDDERDPADAGRVETTSAKELILESAALLLVIGEEMSGKTSLAKQLTFEFRRKKQFVVYLDAKQLTNFHDQFLTSTLDRLTEVQYGRMGAEGFHSLPQAQRVLMIDDFHRFRGNAPAFIRLKNFFDRTFGKTILFAGDSLDARGLGDPELSAALTRDAKSYELLPFGNQLRYELIERWMALGREQVLSSEELERMVGAAKRQIDQFVDRRTVPALPAYVLIILQQMEAMSEATSAVRDGSHGRLYEALITRDLDKRIEQLDLEGAYFYLSRLAERVSSNADLDLGIENAREFHRQHCLDFTLDAEFERLIAELIQARVLERRYERLRFKHPYFFYYFFGKYIATNLNEVGVKHRLASLLTTLHAEESYNVLLFACFHDRTGSVLTAVMRRAQQFYRGRDEGSYSGISELMKDRSSGTVRAILLDGPRAEVRAMVSQVLDENEATNQLAKLPPDEGASKEELDRVLELNGAVKCLQLLGQMLRNQVGITGSAIKSEAITISRQLSARITNVIIESLRRSTPVLLRLFSEASEDESLGSEASVEAAQRALRAFMRRTSTSLAQRAANALASKHLLTALRQELWSASTATTDSKIVYVGSVLECSDDFPKAEVTKLWEVIPTKDVASLTVLRDLVVRRLYLYPDREELRKAVCDLLGIVRRPLLQKMATDRAERRQLEHTGKRSE